MQDQLCLENLTPQSSQGLVVNQHPRPRPSPQERMAAWVAGPGSADSVFWSKVKIVESGCWEWTAARNLPPVLPYGRYKRDGIERKAHRYSWELVFGTLPDGLLACHKCDNPPCVNPFHLFAGTHKDNIDDMVSKKRWCKTRKPNSTGLGEDHHLSKLTENDVLWIRANYRKGEFGAYRIAKLFSVSKPNILAIIKGTTWRHLLG